MRHNLTRTSALRAAGGSRATPAAQDGARSRSCFAGLLTAVLASAGLTTGAAPAHADGTYPGTNGLIAYAEKYVPLLVMTPGGPPRTIVRADNNSPVWSPDGTRLAAGDTIMNADATQVTRHTYVGSPRDWAPDGSTFVTTGTSAVGMSLVSADGSAIRTLSATMVNTAKFSPDGSTIVYSDNSGFSSFIQSDGTSQRTFAQGTAFDWTRDGTAVLMSYGSQLRIVEAADPTQYRTVGQDAYQPRLSPDGTQIAYISDNNLRVVGLDGSNDHEIVANAGNDLEWSPDGTQIVFNEPYIRARDTPDIMLINADGTGVTRLVERDETGWVDLSWGPRTTPLPTIQEQLHQALAQLRVTGKPKVGTTLQTTPVYLTTYWSTTITRQWYAGTKNITKQSTKEGHTLKLTKKLKGKVIKAKFTVTWKGDARTRTVRVGKVK